LDINLLALFSGAERPEITSKGLKRGGLLLVINVDDTQKEAARKVFRTAAQWM
jgi:hypothetical protein